MGKVLGLLWQASEDAEQGVGDYIAIVALFVMVLFTLVAGIIIWRRGRKRWGGWTLVASLVPLLGPVLAIVGLAKGSTKEVPLDEICPECGGVSGFVHTGHFDRESKQRVPHPIAALISGLVGAAILVGGVLIAIAVWAGGDENCSGAICIEWRSGSEVAGIAFLAMGFWLGRAAGTWAIAYIRADRVAGTGYQCAGCEHKWTSLSELVSPATI